MDQYYGMDNIAFSYTIRFTFRFIFFSLHIQAQIFYFFHIILWLYSIENIIQKKNLWFFGYDKISKLILLVRPKANKAS
ncbi:hypothetical protein DERP_012614 [Dermatophagoides pteronyssinus]|uniref:Uncharacterized protein n=1 Tax=Dermatophagoides pteronyssinus TaxID=6956 RepID=A0ABQ8IVR7_DERPT|nr:hypothetical protein DERP_012614 [Dermatophagoides pteronyssinus]